MSVALNSKFGEFEDDSVELMALDNKSKYGRCSQILGIICGSVWWIAAAVMFLLLIFILGVVAHNSSAIGHRDSTYEGLIQKLITERDTMKDERDQLKMNSSTMMKDKEVLVKDKEALTKDKEALTKDKEALTKDKEALTKDKEVLTKDKEALTKDKEALTKDKEVLTKDKEALTKDKEVLTKDKEALTKDKEALTKEKEALTKEKEVQCSNVTARQDKLIKEADNLTPNTTRKTWKCLVASNFTSVWIPRKHWTMLNANNIDDGGKTCPEGWKTFGNSCYYFSRAGSTKTWDQSRKDCKDRGADLVVITSQEELNFVSRSYAVTWIGLSDKERENTWKWVDGTELVGDQFWQDGEPNNADGNEDCAEVSRSAKQFNDVPCRRTFSWACEM